MDDVIYEAGQSMKRSDAAENAAAGRAGVGLEKEGALLNVIASQIQINPAFTGAEGDGIVLKLRTMACRLDAAAKELAGLRADKARLEGERNAWKDVADRLFGGTDESWDATDEGMEARRRYDEALFNQVENAAKPSPPPTPSSPCTQAIDAIGPFLTGSLDDDARARFVGHVQECEACHDKLTTLELFLAGADKGPGVGGEGKGE